MHKGKAEADEQLHNVHPRSLLWYSSIVYSLVSASTKKMQPKTSSEVEKQELVNLMRQLEYTKNEYLKYKKRLEQLSDADYAMQLQERNLQLANVAKKLKNDKKVIESKQTKEKYVDDKLVDCTSELGQEIVALNEEILHVSEKIGEAERTMEEKSKSPQEQLSRFFAMKERWKELLGEMNELSGSVGDGAEKSELGEKYKELARSKSNIAKILNLLKTRHTNTANEYKQKILHSKLQIARIADSLQQKNM